jgi:hypothetical protein
VASKTLPYPDPKNVMQYATDLDVELGAPLNVSPSSLAVTEAWVEVESPTFPGWNGLGTELDLPGAKPDPSNSHVYDYPTPQEGLDAAVDEIKGGGPQTTADAPAFAKDIASNNATTATLIGDIRSSKWAGLSIPDTYDANAISSKLGVSASSTPGHHSGLDTFLTLGGHLPGGGVINDVVGAPESLAKGALSGIAGTVGNYILKGALSIVSAGLVFYGAVILTGRNGKSAGSAASGGAAGSAVEPEEIVPFGPEDALLAPG